MRDPYEALAVARSATAADIKKSFRELAKRLHPDANHSDPKAAALFAELIAAHQILGDEEKRRAFDNGEIDAQGKPTPPRAIAHRSKPSMSTIVTSLMAVMTMLFITATLILRGLSSDETIDTATDDGVGMSKPAPADQSTPRLIFWEGVSYAAAADSMPLGIQVSTQADGLALEFSGLPSGMTISSGRQLRGGGWRILAADVGSATIQPPPGFSGAVDLAVTLRLIDDTVVDRGSLHFEWLPKPAVAAKRIESVDVPPAVDPSPVAENPADKALPIPPPADQNAAERATDSHPDHEPIELLIGKSEKLIAAGDVETARRLLQPAAEAHDARAALALGASYDPIMLAMLRGPEATSDISLALDWYKKARAFGSPEAEGRAKLLSARVAAPKRHVFAPKQAHTSPGDPYGVYVAGTRVGSDPDLNIRAQLLRDDAGRQLRTTPNGAAESPQ